MAPKKNIEPVEQKEGLNENETEEVKVEYDANKVEEYIAKLNDDLETQKKKAEEYCDGLKRNMADFDNFKKRINKEKDSLYVSILTDIVEAFLPILDNFETALSAKSKDIEYKKGIEMIYKDIKEVLNNYNVEEIKDLGETFDPEYHEAVMSVTDDSKGEKEIVEVFRKGYKIKDKVVRHSLVKVAN